MAKLRMEVAGTERVAELMEEVRQKALELEESTRQLTTAVAELTVSGTLEPDADCLK